MVIMEYEENVISDIEGAVIDIETIGEFNKLYRQDSRQYKDIKQVSTGI